MTGWNVKLSCKLGLSFVIRDIYPCVWVMKFKKNQEINSEDPCKRFSKLYAHENNLLYGMLPIRVLCDIRTWALKAHGSIVHYYSCNKTVVNARALSCYKHMYHMGTHYKHTFTRRCTPRPILCSLTCASNVSHQVVACVTTVRGCLSKCCSSSGSNLTIGWVRQCATVHNYWKERYIYTYSSIVGTAK